MKLKQRLNVRLSAAVSFLGHTMRFRPRLISRRDYIERQKHDVIAHALKTIASIQRRAGLRKSSKMAKRFMVLVDKATRKVIADEAIKAIRRRTE